VTGEARAVETTAETTSVEATGSTRLFVAWLVVVGITLMYLWIDHSADESGALLASTAVTVAAIGLALVKVWIIMREFMDVRHAPAWLRWLTNAMVAVIAASLLCTYLVGRSVA
jgi:hypothetical protein